MNLKQKFDLLCQEFSLLITFGLTFIVLALCWFTAFFNPSMSVLVTINTYGEAIPELVMWFVMTPICTYGLYLNWKLIWGKWIDLYSK
jgi:hypothetical protein